MAEITAKELREEWAHVDLIQGIPLKYKHKELVFPKVHMRSSHMGDQEVFSKVDGKNLEQSNDASKKVFTLVTRVIAEEAYLYEDKNKVIQIGLANRKIKPLERKFEQAKTDDDREEIEDKIKKIRADLKKKIGEYPVKPYSGDETILMFVTECFSDEKTLPVDFVRLAKSFQELNYLEEEEIDNFLTLPGN